MKRAVILFIALSTLSTSLNCSSGSMDPAKTVVRDLTSAEKSLARSGNLFGFKLFKGVASQDTIGNIFVSPLSVSMALGMAYNGASGETRTAMEKTMELSGLSAEEVNESYRSLMTLLAGLDPEVKMEIANSIWYRKGLEVKMEFIDLNRNYFAAEVNSLNFDDPNAADIINAWVSKSTRGKIADIVQSPIPSDLVMFLINALYFKGFWTSQFDKNKTADDWFISSDGSRTPCKMMRQDGKFEYYETETLQAIRLPYGDDRFGMVVVLPSESAALDSLVARMDWETWNKWTSSLRLQEGEIYLPRFKMEYNIELKSVLTSLGMGIAFDPYKADFTNISAGGELYISKVKHKTYIDVNEEGSEAAAVTSVEVGITSIGPSGFMMRVDRPFIFAVQEKRSQTIMFIGKVVSPDSK
jgi:serpin B